MKLFEKSKKCRGLKLVRVKVSKDPKSVECLQLARVKLFGNLGSVEVWSSWTIQKVSGVTASEAI